MEQDKFIIWEGPNNHTMAHSKHLRLLISGASAVSLVICSLFLSLPPPSEPLLFFQFWKLIFTYQCTWLLAGARWFHTCLAISLHWACSTSPPNVNWCRATPSPPNGRPSLGELFHYGLAEPVHIGAEGVSLLPAHHSHPDNLVNKAHRWALSLSNAR